MRIQVTSNEKWRPTVKEKEEPRDAEELAVQRNTVQEQNSPCTSTATFITEFISLYFDC